MSFISIYLNNFKTKNNNRRNCRFDFFSRVSGSEFFGKNYVGRKSKFYYSSMGYGTYIGNSCDLSNVRIGKYSCIGSCVKSVSGTHPTRDFVSIHPAFYSNENQIGYSYVDRMKFQEFIYADKEEGIDVVIGNDVWIGSDVVLLAGTIIGDGAIIAAGSVVRGKIEPYSIYGGVPAKLIRYRFSEDQIDKLMAFQWWNRKEDWIKEHADSFENIERFIGLVEHEK